MANGVTDVVGEGADGEGEFVGGVGVMEKTEDEVSGPDVVGKVGEELVAEGVVTGVLDGAATVGVAMCLLNLGLGEGRVLPEQDWTDGLLPGEVDEFFVGLDRVGRARRGYEKQGQERYRLEKSGMLWDVNYSTSGCGTVMNVPTLYREEATKERAYASK
jgi:hypothetical protein